jgi:hypothetical protein
MNFPRISFGIIVLNGEPFTRYCIRSIYPFAHEIIVVEGGHEGARAVTTADGHSIDGTLESLLRFKREEDPENKIQIITNKGHWPQKDEMGHDRTPQSRAYAERVTGDYLWQVDIDEFYHPEDMRLVIQMLRDDPEISVVSFWVHTFWGSLQYAVDGWKQRRGDEFIRLFKWGDGYRYITHEPPTVQDNKGIDLRSYKYVSGEEMKCRGIKMFHYAHLFPRQVLQKAQVYHKEKPDLYADILSWTRNNYFQIKDPYHIERHFWFPSWLVRFKAVHPPESQKMMDDIVCGRVKEDLRKTEDVEQLLRSKSYFLGQQVHKLFDYLDRFYHWVILKHHVTRHVLRLGLERMMPREYRKYYRITEITALDKVLFEPLKRFYS